jgi:hypothetical protein
MSNVFVVDTNKQPLNPVHPGRARILLSSGKAAVYRSFPFTIILKGAVEEQGYQTGDIVRAVVHQGKKIGTYVGKVAVRSSGSFNITTTHGVVQGISHRYCTPIHRSDGYRYEKGAAAFPPIA